MSNKTYYTVPSNQIVNSIRNNKYYTEPVKTGMIKLYTISPSVQNETHLAATAAIKFCKSHPEVQGFKVSKLVVTTPHEMYDVETDKKNFDDTIVDLFEGSIEDVSMLENAVEAYLIDVVVDIEGELEDFPGEKQFNYRYIKLKYADEETEPCMIEFVMCD